MIRDIGIVCSLNNNAGIVYEDGKFNKRGEPTEAALKVFAKKLGDYDSKFKRTEHASKNPEAYTASFASQYEHVASLDFTSERKTMSTVVKGLVKPG